MNPHPPTSLEAALAEAKQAHSQEVERLAGELAAVKAELSSIRDIVWRALEIVGDFDQNSPNELLCQFLAGELQSARAIAQGLAGALQHGLSKTPSICRCINFTTPPHVCIEHRALAAYAALGQTEPKLTASEQKPK